MASEFNNNINDLDALIDDDPTDRLNPLTASSEAHPAGADKGSNSTSQFFALDPLVIQREERILELETDIERRDERIQALEDELTALREAHVEEPGNDEEHSSPDRPGLWRSGLSLIRRSGDTNAVSDGEIRRMRQRMDRKERAAVALEREVARLQKENRDLLDRIKNLEARLSTRDAGDTYGELGEIWKELCERDAALEAAQSRILELESDLAQAGERLAERDFEQASSGEKLVSLDKELDEARDALSAALLRNAELLEQLHLVRDWPWEALETEGTEIEIGERETYSRAQPDHEASGEYPPPKVGRALLVVDDESSVRYPLFKERLTIGRTSINDIQLRTPYVSRSHAAIINEHDRVHIVDLGSKNGLYINGERRPRADLKPGDRLAIGDTVFEYHETHRD